MRAPLTPVLLRRIPLAGPEAAVPADTLLNFRFAAPMAVLSTLMAVPVVVTIVLVVSVALTVPPPMAVKASLEPVLSVIGPLKLIVAPVLLVRRTPVDPAPVTLIGEAESKEIVPPVLLTMEMPVPLPL